MNLTKLNNEELVTISGGVDEPAYGIGYYIGYALNEIDKALGYLFFGSDWGFYK